MCPPGVDQTERSPQRWSILIPGIRKKISIDHWSRPSRWDFPKQYVFNEEAGWNAWSLLAVPPKNSEPFQSKFGRSTTSTSLSRLEVLPAELLSEIISDDSLDMKDVISLGLASQNLWIHVLNFVLRSTANVQGSLIGEKMACIGNYLKDLPEPFQIDDLLKKSIDYHLRGARYAADARKINYGCLDVFEELDTVAVEQNWMNAFERVIDQSKIVKNEREQLREELDACSSILRGQSPNSEWALRNLTTKEFVRIVPGVPNPGNGFRGYINPLKSRDLRSKSATPGHSHLRIDQILFLRFCWTRRFEYSFTDAYNYYRHFRGPWAGHAFDVIIMEDFDHGAKTVGENGNKKWRDVTGRVLKHATQVENLFNP